MRKQLYNFIGEQLAAIDGQPVKKVDIWNNQMDFIEEEQPFFTPAVFIEFEPISWRMMGNAVYESAVMFHLHIVTDGRVGAWSEVIEVFDLIDSINRQLHGQHTDGIDAVTRITSTTDNRFGELMHNIESYSCHIIDVSAMPVRKTVSTVKPKINI
jgi:hypothetical protein